MPGKLKTQRGVLIVEDDQVNRDALVHLLTHLGYQTVAVSTVAEGLACLNGQVCAILDLNLPDGLGTIILERIRANTHPMRVALATGTTDENLLNDALKYRPDLLLRKPFDVNLLLDWLEASG